MQFNEAEFAALDQGAAALGIFFRLDTTPVVALWSGVGDYAPGTDVIDSVTGITYRGIGALTAIPQLTVPLNGSANRIDFTLSGLDAPADALVGDAAQVRGKKIDLGICIMNAAWAQLGPIRWVSRYTADQIKGEVVPGKNYSEAVVRTVTLSAVSRMSRRRRPQIAYLSDADQQRRSPGDRFCERVALYQAGIENDWPNWSYTA